MWANILLAKEIPSAAIHSHSDIQASRQVQTWSLSSPTHSLQIWIVYTHILNMLESSIRASARVSLILELRYCFVKWPADGYRIVPTLLSGNIVSNMVVGWLLWPELLEKLSERQADWTYAHNCKPQSVLSETSPNTECFMQCAWLAEEIITSHSSKQAQVKPPTLRLYQGIKSEILIKRDSQAELLSRLYRKTEIFIFSWDFIQLY